MYMYKSMDIVLITNGVYDIVCVISINLQTYHPVLRSISRLHLNMFTSVEHRSNAVIQRVLSYWIMTYGMIRLCAGLCGEKELYKVASISYFLEALCYEYENQVGKTLVCYKVYFVSVFSTILGIIVMMISLQK